MDVRGISRWKGGGSLLYTFLLLEREAAQVVTRSLGQQLTLFFCFFLRVIIVTSVGWAPEHVPLALLRCSLICVATNSTSMSLQLCGYHIYFNVPPAVWLPSLLRCSSSCVATMPTSMFPEPCGYHLYFDVLSAVWLPSLLQCSSSCVTTVDWLPCESQLLTLHSEKLFLP